MGSRLDISAKLKELFGLHIHLRLQLQKMQKNVLTHNNKLTHATKSSSGPRRVSSCVSQEETLIAFGSVWWFFAAIILCNALMYFESSPISSRCNSLSKTSLNRKVHRLFCYKKMNLYGSGKSTSTSHRLSLLRSIDHRKTQKRRGGEKI